MNEMAYYNDTYFNENFKNYHPDDNSLVCQNNKVYYYGDTKVISGMINVHKDETLDLGTFKVSNINNNIWPLEPYQIFFFIRESVKIAFQDIKNSLMGVYKLASKNDLDETDKFSLNYFVDYYNALKSIEKNLSGDLFDAYKYIKDMFTTVSSMNDRNITPGFRLIYEKVFGEIKSDYTNDSAGNANGVSRTRYSGPKPVAPAPVPIYSSNESEDNQKFSNAAFISVCALVILILAIVIGTMTYIFS